MCREIRWKPPVRKTWRAFLLATILIGLGVLALCRVFFTSTPRGPISLTFTGFVKVRPSSDAPTGEVASFLLINGAPTPICYYVESIEYRTTDGWLTNALRRTPTEWRSFGAELGPLGPFESRVLLVPPPANGVWRLRLGGNEQASGIKGFIDRLRDYRDYFDWKKFGLTAERFEGRSFQTVSGDVTERSERE